MLPYSESESCIDTGSEKKYRRVEKYTEAGEKSVFFMDFAQNKLSKIHKKIGKLKLVLGFMAKMQKFRIPIDKIPFTWYDYPWLVGANCKRGYGHCPFIL